MATPENKTADEAARSEMEPAFSLSGPFLSLCHEETAAALNAALNALRVTPVGDVVMLRVE